MPVERFTKASIRIAYGAGGAANHLEEAAGAGTKDPVGGGSTVTTSSLALEVVGLVASISTIVEGVTVGVEELPGIEEPSTKHGLLG